MWIIYWALFGAIMGSFSNMLIWRLPRHENWVVKPSYCPNCGHRLGLLDLIPIVSYVLLGGRCRYCKQPISPRYLIVELISATLWGFIPIVYTNYGLYYAIAYAVFIFFSLIIAVEDWYYQEVLSALLYIPLVVVGLLLWYNWASAAFLSVMFLVLYGASFLIFKKQGLGDGDIIYAAICGFMLTDVMQLGYFLLVCSVAGIITAVLYALATRSGMKSLQLPFLPAMFASTLILCGITIL